MTHLKRNISQQFIIRRYIFAIFRKTPARECQHSIIVLEMYMTMFAVSFSKFEAQKVALYVSNQ